MRTKDLVWTLLIALSVLAQPALAQTYPAKSVRIVVPFAPGGSADSVARPVAERLGTLLGQPFLIENRPGAVATIGAAIVAKADPDGYTLLLVPGTHVLAPRLVASVPYHPINDFTPIANVVFAPLVIVSAKQHPFSTLRDMVQYAKQNPEKLAIGNSEVITRLGAEALAQAANIKLNNVNYKGGGPIASDVLGGHLALGVVTPVAVLAFQKERKVNVLAVTSPKRLPSMPDVPTVSEALGVPQFDVQSWFALAGPAGMPRPIVERLHRAVAQILLEPDIRDRILNMGLIPAEDSSPEGLANLMKTFGLRNGALMEAAKIKME